MKLPSYQDLPSAPGRPERYSWGLFGSTDVLGCLNLLTPERIVEAARLVRTGKVFALNWEMELPDPPLFQRSRAVHCIVPDEDWEDDVLASWNTQSSSQWDGFRHVRAPGLGYYNGLDDSYHGVHHWARRGIVGRGVLVDLAAHRRSINLPPFRLDESDSVSVEELIHAIESSPSSVRDGDILLLHFGWVEWYSSLDVTARQVVARESQFPGLCPSEDLLRLLWDLHIAAVAADCPAVERFPPNPTPRPSVNPGSTSFAHYALLPLLGLPMGELFDLSKLAADCEADDVYEGLFTSAPLNLEGGVASPPNALFLK